MGRGIAWDNYERQVAAKAYVKASENSIKGADQKATTFMENIHRYVISFTPTTNTDNRRYAARSPQNIYDFLKANILPDIQKFSSAINIIKVSMNTGNPSETDICCMAIAHHLRWCSGADPAYMCQGKLAFNPALKWNNYLAFLELKKNPKFFTSPININSISIKRVANDITNLDTDLDDNEPLEIEGETTPEEVVDLLDYETPSRKLGQKKAKSELKNKKHNNTNFDITLTNITSTMESIANAQEKVLKLMEKGDNHNKLHVLKSKYRRYKNVDNDKAASILVKIEELEDIVTGETKSCAEKILAVALEEDEYDDKEN